MNMVLKTSDLINVTNVIMLLRQVVLREECPIDTLYDNTGYLMATWTKVFCFCFEQRRHVAMAVSGKGS